MYHVRLIRELSYKRCILYFENVGQKLQEVFTFQLIYHFVDYIYNKNTKEQWQFISLVLD